MSTETHTAEPAMKECYYCAESIRADAIKCRHCGSDVSRPPPRERLRIFSSSPWVGVVSLLFGVVGGSAEALNLYRDLRSDETPKDPGFFPTDPAEQVTDAERLLVLVAALAVGSVGFAAAFLARRRPTLAAALFAGAGVAGLVVSLLVAGNVVLVVLSGLLLVVAAVTAVASADRVRA